PLAVQGRAKAFVGDIALDDLGNRGAEDHVDGLFVVVEKILDLFAGWRLADPRVALPMAQGAADAGEQVLVCQEPLDVALADAEALDRFPRLPLVVPQRKGGAVLERPPEVGPDGGAPVAAPA